MNSKTLRLATGFFAAASLWISSLSALGDIIVYSNATVRLDKYYAPGIAQFGDEIILSGGAGQHMTSFTFEYTGIGLSGNETVTLRVYKNDGAVVLSGSIPALKPNTKFYDSGAFPINNTQSDGNTLRFDLPLNDANLIIPNNSYDFTWTVQFGGIDSASETAGLDLYSPPNVGNNYADYWEQNPISLDWELKSGPAGTPVMSFGATMTAVPEPSPLQVGLLAGAIWLGWSIYRRKAAA